MRRFIGDILELSHVKTDMISILLRFIGSKIIFSNPLIYISNTLEAGN